MDIDNIIDEINIFKIEHIKRRKICLKYLSRVDKELSDVYHQLEFGKFNASQGYKFAKSIKDLRIKRRKIKKVYAFLESITNSVNKKIDLIEKEK